MLSRAALPLLRPRAFPSPVRLSLALQQSRWYAKDKPRKYGDYKIPASAPPSSRYPFPKSLSQKQPPQRSSEPDYDAERDYSPEQERIQQEFQTDARSECNTEPLTDGAGPAFSTARRVEEVAAQDASDVQPEFETSPASSTNTAPKPSPNFAFESVNQDVAPSETRRTPESRPLPDLTQGIPSTLDAELAEAEAKRQATHALNVTEQPEEPFTGGRGGGDRPKSEYISSLDRKRNRIAQIMMGVLAALAVTGTAFSGRNWDTEEEEKKHPDAPSGWGFGLFYNRMKARIADITDYYNEPAFPRLLPDKDPKYDAPFTLVLSLEDLLVHSEWTREHGWRLAKRPGVDYFLRYLSQYYELVLFTSSPSMLADPVLRKLDPYRVIRWPLFREATRYKDGEYIKDLAYLNRDLSKVIMIDTVPAHASEQPENAIILPKWKGDPNDKILVAFIPFLEYIATMGFDDTREVMKSFEGKYIPLEFARREKAIRDKFEAQLAEERKKRPKRSIGSLGSLFGIKTPPPVIEGMSHSTSDGWEQGKMLWDQIRERGQKQYEAIDKEIRENGEKWLAEMAAEEEKLKEEQMKGMKSSMTGWFGGVGGGK